MVGFFHCDVKNLQLTAVGGGSNSTKLISAKIAMGQGMEFNLDAYPTEHLLITVGGSIKDSRIKFPSLAVAGSAQCTITDPKVVMGGLTFYKIDGNPLPQAPGYTMNLTARYGIPMGAGAEAFIYTAWICRSEVNFFL